jgi:hypothetical protein
MRKSLLRLFSTGLVISLAGCTSGNSGGQTTHPATTATVVMDSGDGGVADGANNISLTPQISLKFSQSMNPLTVNDKTIKLSLLSEALKTQTAVPISSIVANPNNTVFQFSPIDHLLSNTKYYITVTSDSKTSNGSGVSGQFSFTTGDYTAPEVSIIKPSNQAKNVSTSPSIQLQFSEVVKNINPSNVSLHEESSTGSLITIGSITNGANNTYTFNPANQLKQQTLYYVVLESGITDESGNKLSSKAFNFQTGDFLKPVADIITPSNNATGTPISQIIQIKFSEPVKNVTPGSLTLHEGSVSGPLVTIGNIVAGDSKTYTFNSVERLKTNTAYYVVLNDGIADYAGNKLENTNFHFTTGDLIAPTVSIISPSNNKTDAPTYPTFRIKFSEAVTNVNDATISLHQGSPSGTLIPINPPLAEGDNSYSFTTKWATKLTNETSYYLVLNNGIIDKFGNSLTPINFSFTTETYWISVGNPGFTDSQISWPNLLLGIDNTPYITYAEGKMNDPQRVSVLKYDGVNWVPLGNQFVSAGKAAWPKLASAADGTIYLSYTDMSNGYKATVMKFNGSTWETLGTATSGMAGTPRIAIGSNGIPYLAYVAESGLVTVMKYNGTKWENIGTLGKSGRVPDHYSIKLELSYDNIPYVAYIDGTNANQATVMKYNSGTTWSKVGTGSISTASINDLSLALLNDKSTTTPYIAYEDGSKANVKKFDGTNWIQVSKNDFPAGAARDINLKISATGTPYVAYTDSSVDSKLTVMKLSKMLGQDVWIPVGNPGISSGQIDDPNMVISNTGELLPYVVYSDSARGGKATVMRLRN